MLYKNNNTFYYLYKNFMFPSKWEHMGAQINHNPS